MEFFGEGALEGFGDGAAVVDEDAVDWNEKCASSAESECWKEISEVDIGLPISFAGVLDETWLEFVGVMDLDGESVASPFIEADRCSHCSSNLVPVWLSKLTIRT